MTRPSSRTLVQVGLFALAVLFVALLPYRLSDFRAQQFAYVAVYLIALIGLNILTGYTGQISLGHGAFMAIGGYTTAILVSDQGLNLAGHTFGNDLRDVWTIPLAGLVAGIFGLLFGIPALRLTGLYLALATFAVAVATPAVIKRFDGLTGGGTGINLFGLEGHTGSQKGVATILGRELSFNDWLYYLCWTVGVIMFALGWFILRGRLGRAFRAVRDSELAAASSGVNLARHKTLAFGISAFYAGVAGALYTTATTFANPETFPITLSIYLLVGVVVGGLGSLSTLFVGAIFIQFMSTEWAQEMDGAIPDWLPILGDVNTKSPGAPSVVFGVTLILVMLALPMGAAGLVVRVRGLAGRVYTRLR